MLNVKFQGNFMKIIFTLFVLTIFAGCASVPANYGKPAMNSKVGVLLLVDKSPKYSHVGTTIFNNADSTTTSKTNFRDRFEKSITSKLEKAGHTAKVVNSNKTLLSSRDDLFSYMSSNVNFKENIKAELNKLASKEDLDFIILVYPNVGPAWPNSSAYISGYGLYTRCMFSSCNAFALDYVGARIFDIKNNSSLKPMDFGFFDMKKMTTIVVPDVINDVTPAQIDEAAEQALKKFIILLDDMLKTSEFI